MDSEAICQPTTAFAKRWQQAFGTMTKKLRSTILLTLITISSFGQQYNFDLDKVKFKGLGLKTTKKVITEKFGQGRRVETNYECGFFASDSPRWTILPITVH